MCNVYYWKTIFVVLLSPQNWSVWVEKESVSPYNTLSFRHTSIFHGAAMQSVKWNFLSYFGCCFLKAGTGTTRAVVTESKSQWWLYVGNKGLQLTKWLFLSQHATRKKKILMN